MSRAGSRHCSYDSHYDEITQRMYFREFFVRLEPNSKLECNHGVVFLEGDSTAQPPFATCDCAHSHCAICARDLQQICLLPECIAETHAHFDAIEHKLNALTPSADVQERLWQPIYIEQLSRGSWKAHQARDPTLKSLLNDCRAEPILRPPRQYFIKKRFTTC